MKCQEFGKAINDLIEGQSDEVQSAQMLQHAHVCENCAEHLRYMQRLKESLQALGGNITSVDCWSYVRARISVVHKRVNWHTAALKYALAPSLAALLLAGYIFMAPRNEEAQDTIMGVQPFASDFVGLNTSFDNTLPLSDSDTYFVAAGMQALGGK